MYVQLNLQIEINNDKVQSFLRTGKLEDADTNLLTIILKVFGDVQNRVQTQISKFNNAQAIKDVAAETSETEESTIDI